MRLSVVIPTLNEADSLAETVASLRRSWVVAEPEILISESGSTDSTVALAESLDVRIVGREKPARFKAEALNAGARQARGEVIWFLDADTPAPAQYDRAILAALSQAQIAGGAFEFALQGARNDFRLRMIERINRLRYRIWPRYFGDQGIFVRRTVFSAIGGFPPLRLMEASHLCLSLRRGGHRLILLEISLETSPRRFLAQGPWKVLARDSQIWLKDLLGFSVEAEARGYHQLNRDRGEQASPE